MITATSMKENILILLLVLTMGKLCATQPTLVAPSNDSIDAPTGIAFAWLHITGATYYNIDLDTTPLFNSGMHTVIIGKDDYSSKTAGDTISDTLFELHYGTKYYWKVTPQNLVGSSASNISNFTTILQPKLFGPANFAHLDFNIDYPAVYHDMGNHFYTLEIGNTTVFTSPIYIQVFGDMILAQHHEVLRLGPLSNITVGNTYYWRVRAHNSSDSSEWSDTLAFIAINPLSATDISAKDGSIYPNPAINELTFNLIESPSKVFIYDAQGKLMVAEIIENKQRVIDVSKLTSGVYFIRIENLKKEAHTQKLVIAK